MGEYDTLTEAHIRIATLERELADTRDRLAQARGVCATWEREISDIEDALGYDKDRAAGRAAAVLDLKRELAEARAKHKRLLLSACGELVEAEEERDRLREALSECLMRAHSCLPVEVYANLKRALAGGEPKTTSANPAPATETERL